MRPGAPLALLLILAAGGAAAEGCDPERLVSEFRDRCRATYIEVDTADGGWRRVSEEEEPMCFKPKDEFWNWNCRGIEEGARCKSSRLSGAAGAVGVRLSKGEVTWSCYAN